MNENIGYIAGDGSEGILKTTDAGITWSIHETGTSNSSLLDINFYDEDHGFAVGQSGLILYTDNGGASWTSQESGTTTRLNSVKMVSPTNAVVVGFNGTILRNFGTLDVNKEIISNNFAVFPNPMVNNLTITGNKELNSIQVFNVLGKLHFEDSIIFSNSYSIDFSTFSKGVYFLKISDENGNSSIKRVIKK